MLTQHAPLPTQVRVKVNSLHGVLPYVQQAQDQLGHFHPTAAFVVATLSAGGDVLGLQTQTTYTDTLQEGAMWAEWLTFCVKVCAGLRVFRDTLVASGRATVTQGPTWGLPVRLCMVLLFRPPPTHIRTARDRAGQQACTPPRAACTPDTTRLTDSSSLLILPRAHTSLPPVPPSLQHIPPPRHPQPHTHTAVPRPAL